MQLSPQKMTTHMKMGQRRPSRRSHGRLSRIKRGMGGEKTELHRPGYHPEKKDTGGNVSRFNLIQLNYTSMSHGEHQS